MELKLSAHSTAEIRLLARLLEKIAEERDLEEKRSVERERLAMQQNIGMAQGTLRGGVDVARDSLSPPSYGAGRDF